MSFNEERRRRAVLVALAPSAAELAETEIELSELMRLLDTAGGEYVARMIQVRPTPDAATCIGSGKLEELRDLCNSEEAGLVVFNNELSPSQVRNIEEALEGVDVIDRTMLILDIFALHAVSGEGKLQVELAQLKYTASRLIGNQSHYACRERAERHSPHRHCGLYKRRKIHAPELSYRRRSAFRGQALCDARSHHAPSHASR